MLVRLVIGLVMTVIALGVAGRRAFWLYRLISSGQPAHDRTDRLGQRVRAQFVEVFGQRTLLKWSVPGLAHFFTFWAFVILISVYIEAYGALFDADFHIPLIGQWSALGFLQDFIAAAALISLGVFAVLRIRQSPDRRQRASRFYGSHTGGAWLILFMIFNVLWTMFLYRGAASALDLLPYDSGAFVSIGVGNLLVGLPVGALEILESIGLLLHIGVMLAFTVIIAYSKHLHIFTAPINVSAKRLPKALGPLPVMESAGRPIDFEDPGEDDVFGRGKVEDFTWKGMLDFATCTECGRCQSQCPAWNTGKPLSPKLVIMDLRDHLLAKAPYIIGGKTVPDDGAGPAEGALDFAAAGNGHSAHSGVPESGFERVRGSGPEQATRPLVGTLEAGGVIDPDVLWSCTTCGACVEQCPVDIEHIDHIVDMRRHQVLVESEFPSELGVLFRNLESKGNPWGQNSRERLDWTKKLDFEVPVFDGELAADTEYLFWIGCAGTFDDNARKTVRATAELLHRAGVGYVVLGPEETCTGDPARRSGNEFLFQMLAAQNVEVLNAVFEGREPGTRKIVTTCPHCLNTLGREYPQLDGHYEVVHHTQLLNRLVSEGKLVPVAAPDRTLTDVTYHDPCYLGRHNEIYEEPRELVGAAGLTLSEMPRHADRSFCCGAGGARMWMEEKIGKRVNLERVDEALGTGAEKIATGCPFCRVMFSDGLTQRQSEDQGAGVEILDVSQMLLASVKRGDTEPEASRLGAGARDGGSTNGVIPEGTLPDIASTETDRPRD
ncbi:MAG: heterodisulfide reductase-related iron-sulfur binding cluster [Pseudonocardia sp.]